MAIKSLHTEGALTGQVCILSTWDETSRYDWARQNCHLQALGKNLRFLPFSFVFSLAKVE